MSDDKKKLSEIKEEINKFREMFKDNPAKQIKEGTWFEKILHMVLTDHASKVNAEYFKKKYIGLDNERIAIKMVEATSKYTAITGGIAATAVSAAEVSTVVTGGWSIAVLGSSIIGELSYISYLQLKLIYDISIVLDARLDKDDPEDMLTIFWYALGINIWEDISNLLLKAGPRAAEYLGRKALRHGVRKAIQNVAAKIGGTQLAKKITERALLKLIVPGVNIPIAAFVNKKFTKQLGKKAICSLKKRGIVVKIIDKLMKYERIYQIITIPLIYQIGIIDEPKEGLCKNIEMQNIVTRRLKIQESEEEIIDDMIAIDFDEFCLMLKSEIKNKEVAFHLVDIAVYSYCLSKSQNIEKLNMLATALEINALDSRIKNSLKNIN